VKEGASSVCTLLEGWKSEVRGRMKGAGGRADLLGEMRVSQGWLPTCWEGSRAVSSRLEGERMDPEVSAHLWLGEERSRRWLPAFWVEAEA
jgi:hypothetical protein